MPASIGRLLATQKERGDGEANQEGIYLRQILSKEEVKKEWREGADSLNTRGKWLISSQKLLAMLFLDSLRQVAVVKKADSSFELLAPL